MDNQTALSKLPVRDTAEDNAYFPSPYSLSLYTSSKTDFDGTTYPNPYQGGKLKVLMVGADERYVPTQNGKLFSSGNHPVETLLPMYHIDKAGFEIEVATISGNPVKFEYWAMPNEDAAVKEMYEKYQGQFRKPKKLSDIIEQQLNGNSTYIAVLIPGGHGALVGGIPDSEEMKLLLNWAMKHDKYIITLCHGPACLLASAKDVAQEDYIFKNYKICVFPDSIDEGANVDIGYMPGQLMWPLGRRLQALGLELLNGDNISGACFQDRKLITGDSPLAANNLGKMAARALLAEATLIT